MSGATPPDTVTTPVTATLITAESGPRGSEMITLHSERAAPFTVRGRVDATDLPCTVNDRGCGGADTMTRLRLPLFGLNLPGEQIVGEMEHCSVCGPTRTPPRLVPPTPQELADGWAPGTVG
jgi:hypothetical protein